MHTIQLAEIGPEMSTEERGEADPLS